MKTIKSYGISVDLVVVDEKRTCNIIDFAVPGDNMVEGKEKEKIVKIIPLVMGSLGAITKQFHISLKKKRYYSKNRVEDSFTRNG